MEDWDTISLSRTVYQSQNLLRGELHHLKKKIWHSDFEDTFDGTLQEINVNYLELQKILHAPSEYFF